MKSINKIRVNNFAGMIEMIDPGETLICSISETSRVITIIYKVCLILTSHIIFYKTIKEYG